MQHNWVDTLLQSMYYSNKSANSSIYHLCIITISIVLVFWACVHTKIVKQPIKVFVTLHFLFFLLLFSNYRSAERAASSSSGTWSRAELISRNQNRN